MAPLDIELWLVAVQLILWTLPVCFPWDFCLKENELSLSEVLHKKTSHGQVDVSIFLFTSCSWRRIYTSPVTWLSSRCSVFFLLSSRSATDDTVAAGCDGPPPASPSSIKNPGRSVFVSSLDVHVGRGPFQAQPSVSQWPMGGGVGCLG